MFATFEETFEALSHYLKGTVRKVDLLSIVTKTKVESVQIGCEELKFLLTDAVNEYNCIYQVETNKYFKNTYEKLIKFLTKTSTPSFSVDEKLKNLRAQKLQKAVKIEADYLINEFVTRYEQQDDIDFNDTEVLTASNGKPYTELSNALLMELHPMAVGRFKFIRVKDSPSITVHYSWN